MVSLFLEGEKSMVGKKVVRDRGALPPVQQLAFPESDWSRMMKARLVEIEAAKVAHERKWGIGRVNTLVPSEFREKLYAQMERVWAAQEAQDEVKFKAACDGMVRAYKAMDSWALSEGLEPVSKCQVVEGETELGLMVVAPDEATAVQYQALRPDVKQVWTVAELGKLVGSGIGHDLWMLKRELSVRATVVAVQQEKPEPGKGCGFEDMESDLDLTEPDTLPKMFHLPEGARRK